MEHVAGKGGPSLKARVALRLAIGLLVLLGLLFLPAGTWRFWQAWMYVGVMFAFWTYFFVYLLKNDPQLLQRRMQREESDPQQRIFQKMFSAIVFPACILTGLDFRFGWSQRVGPVPLSITLAGQALAVAGYWLVFWTLKSNSFASSTIQVEVGQKVVEHGPYAIVRHPMYLGMALMGLGTPMALGSYVTLPVFALVVPLLVYRLLHEERKLKRELRGYTDYCERTRFRIVPYVW